MQIINKTTGTAIMQVKGLEFLHRLNDLPAGHRHQTYSSFDMHCELVAIKESPAK